MPEPALLVDARAIDHPTAGGRGIGNYTAGLLLGMRAIDVPVVALHDPTVRATAVQVGGSVVSRPWSPSAIREFTGSHYVATGMFLPPIPFDPIPRAVTESGLTVVAVLYDVIPFSRPEVYLVDENARRQARLRAALFGTVDLTVAISEYAAAQGAAVLGLDPRATRVIGAGVDPAFHPGNAVDGAGRLTVVAVTGADPRKNTEGLLRAWTHLPEEVRARHHLVIVADVPPTLARRWRSWAGSQGATSSIEVRVGATRAEVVELMQRAVLAVQPSLDEGFGLPVLEAAACGTPSICSNTSSMPEILDEPAATFDPCDPADMARSIERSLTDADHRDLLLAAGRRAVDRWRWDGVARRLVDAIADVAPGGRAVRPIGLRIGVIGGPDVQSIADALRDATGADVVALLDVAATSDRVVGGAGRAWPAAALGRLVKVHDFDHLVAVLDGRPGEASSRLAARAPMHVILRAGAELPASTLELSRSIIVEGAAAAERLSGSATTPPVLGLPAGCAAADVGRALASWLSCVGRDH